MLQSLLILNFFGYSNNMETNLNNGNSTNIEAFLRGHQVNLEELEQDGDIDIPKKQCKKRRTSKAWGMSMSVCGKVYIIESTYETSNMIKHIKKCPRLKKSRDPHQLILDHLGSIGPCSSKFDQDVFRKLLSTAINKLPFQFVGFNAIRTCFDFLNSEVQNVSRNIAKVDVLKAYNVERLRIKLCFEKKVVFYIIEQSSANEACVIMLKSQLKIRKVVLANGDYLHMRCCTHIINLIIQDGLKTIEGELHKIIESVKYIKASQGRKQKFLERANQMSFHRKKSLRQDVPTRWNSTDIMLDCALYYKSAFSHLALGDSNYKYCHLKYEWNKLKRTSNFLALFYKITCIFSRSKYSTLKLYFPKVFYNLCNFEGVLKKWGWVYERHWQEDA
ncbi:hypothetical protein KPL70_021496 [Citrus sinensis]|nr:hypothetical protein KPL70_021496 [Citrus sinensis]